MMIINKKNLLLVVFLSANSFLCVHGMEKKSISLRSYFPAQSQTYILNTITGLIDVKDKEYSEPMELTKLKDMAPAVKEQILEAERKKVIALQKCKFEHEQNMVLHQYRKNVASIASNPDNLMSKKNRLTYLNGDDYFNHHKSIIKSMIKDDGIDPNEVYWGTHIPHRNPLNHSIALKDIDFTRYLLTSGARPHYEDLRVGGISLMHERVCANDMLRNLFLQYKIMFYRYDCGTIVPEWENVPLQDLKICLLNLINAFKNKKGETTFIITVAPNMAKSGTIEAIEEANFKISYLDNEKIQLVYRIKNG